MLQRLLRPSKLHLPLSDHPLAQVSEPALATAVPASKSAGWRMKATVGAVRVLGCSIATPVWLWLLMLAFILSGCAHGLRGHEPGTSAAGAFAPVPPAFLTGPAAMLLTQADGYSAHVIMSTGAPLPAGQSAAGELRERAGKLVFAPARGQGKSFRGGFSFIWDVAQGRGYVLSEALQSYAPVTANVTPTNLVNLAVSTMAELIDAHPCQQEQATVAMSDGSSAGFRVWRAADLKRFPMRISSAASTTPFTLNFSRIRLESPPAELFAPPDGFTRYESAEAMMTELVVRQHNLKGASPGRGDAAYELRDRR